MKRKACAHIVRCIDISTPLPALTLNHIEHIGAVLVLQYSH